jgi:hypothetical protein
MPRKGKKAGLNKAGLKEHRAAPQAEQNGGRVIERPDGFYWDKGNGEIAGPYATLAEAEADLLADGAADEAEGAESLQEAESELGISEWIDPDTGGPAEDNVPRLEDH